MGSRESLMAKVTVRCHETVIWQRTGNQEGLVSKAAIERKLTHWYLYLGTLCGFWCHPHPLGKQRTG